MLVLTLKEGESVHVGDGRVVIQGLRNGHVRVGFVFAPEVRILRDELKRKMEAAAAAEEAPCE